jgi:RNA polymerase-binding transcription factor DksA
VLTRDQLNGYRQELLTLAASLDQSLTHDRRELRREEMSDLPGGPMSSTDQVDDGTQEVEIGLIISEGKLLGEVIAALARIEAGKFGTCEGCGRPIARTRLDALPYARQCVRCVRAARPTVG